MNCLLSNQDQAFQQEVKKFLATHLPQDIRRKHRCNSSIFMERDEARRWQAVLAERGWAAPQWPVEYGGQDWTPLQHYLFAREYYLAGAPMLMPQGIGMLAPVLFAYGSETQKQRYLPPILSGEHYWCQGYSEPGAGSDLAALALRAESPGDHYRLNGSKLWTTHAHFATHMFCLVRTQVASRPQQGISFLLVDMTLPGISVEPIKTLAGDHEVNQVFFDDVLVRMEDRVGEENQGWTYAKYLLEQERGGNFNSYRLHYEWQQLRDLLAEHPASAAAMQPHKSLLARLEIELRALEMTELRLLCGHEPLAPGTAATILKLQTSRLDQKINELGIAIAAYTGMASDSRAGSGPYRRSYMASLVPRYLNNRAQTIFGGSDEILLNIVARSALGFR